MGQYSEMLSAMKKAGIENYEGELFDLIEFVSQIPYTELFKLRLLAKADESKLTSHLTSDMLLKLSDLVVMRISGVPVQYITGRTDFYGNDFYCSKDVLIPRFDSETAVDSSLRLLNDGDEVLDLCCGSGCIGITLALNKKINISFADISAAALSLCAKNCEKHKVSADIFSYDVFADRLKKKFNLIVCNPPYIETSIIPTLSREVNNEPVLALDGGCDGLKFYRYIIETYKYALKANGYIVFECGAGQAKTIKALFDSNGFSDTKIEKDYAGIDRVVVSKIL